MSSPTADRVIRGTERNGTANLDKCRFMLALQPFRLRRRRVLPTRRNGFVRHDTRKRSEAVPCDFGDRHVTRVPQANPCARREKPTGSPMSPGLVSATPNASQPAREPSHSADPVRPWWDRRPDPPSSGVLVRPRIRSPVVAARTLRDPHLKPAASGDRVERYGDQNVDPESLGGRTPIRSTGRAPGARRISTAVCPAAARFGFGFGPGLGHRFRRRRIARSEAGTVPRARTERRRLEDGPGTPVRVPAATPQRILGACRPFGLPPATVGLQVRSWRYRPQHGHLDPASCATTERLSIPDRRTRQSETPVRRRSTGKRKRHRPSDGPAARPAEDVRKSAARPECLAAAPETDGNALTTRRIERKETGMRPGDRSHGRRPPCARERRPGPIAEAGNRRRVSQGWSHPPRQASSSRTTSRYA